MNNSTPAQDYFKSFVNILSKFGIDNVSSFDNERIRDLEEDPVASANQLALVVICLVIIVTVLNKSLKNEVPDRMSKRKVRTVEDIPTEYHFPYKVPNLVEGLATVHLMKQKGVKLMEEWPKRQGLIFQTHIVTEHVTVVHDPALLQKILGCTDNHVLNKPRFLYDIFFDEWLRDGLLASDVDVWAPHKKIASRTVAYKTLPTYLKMMNKHSKTLVSSLDSHSTNGSMEGELMYNLLYSHSIKIISEIVLGSDSSSETESEDFHLHFKNWKKLLVYRFWNFWNLIPLIWWINPVRTVYNNHVSEISKHMDKDIDKCRKELELRIQSKPLESENTESVNESRRTENSETDGITDGIKPFRSLIEEMVSCNSSAKEIRDEVGTFLSAGHETTMVGMQFFMQHIAEHPEIQAKCQEELDSLFESKQNDDSSAGESDLNFLTMEDLSKLKYLERCILETLRITAVVPVFFRKLSAPLQVDDFKFKTGTTFCFKPWVLHRDPNNYPNPEIFDPDRFLPEHVKKRSIYTFMPFAQGPRICLGWKLALMEMKVVLAWMLRNFDFHTTDRLDDVKILFEITIFPERNYNVSLKRRNKIVLGK